MQEIIFLAVLGIVWIVFAVIQDLRYREIANWLNFSLIIFALGLRFFYSLFSQAGFNFLYQGLIGLGIFFVIGNLFYYSKLFAGGDAKLMIALGAVLPLNRGFYENLELIILFLVIFLFAGAIYTLLVSFSLSIKYFKAFKKEFGKQLKKIKEVYTFLLISGIILLALGFFEIIFLAFGILIFFFANLYVFSKAVDEACMVKKVKTSELREGDWLYKTIKIGRKTIKAKWDGLSSEEIKWLRKKTKLVTIRQGIPFSPVFLISLLILIWTSFNNLGNPFW